MEVAAGQRDLGQAGSQFERVMRGLEKVQGLDKLQIKWNEAFKKASFGLAQLKTQ